MPGQFRHPGHNHNPHDHSQNRRWVFGGVGHTLNDESAQEPEQAALPASPNNNTETNINTVPHAWDGIGDWVAGEIWSGRYPTQADMDARRRYQRELHERGLQSHGIMNDGGDDEEDDDFEGSRSEDAGHHGMVSDADDDEQYGDFEESRSENAGQISRQSIPEDSVDPHSSNNEIECPICAESYPSSKFPQSHTITDGCIHTDKACLDCLDYSIQMTCERGALHELACPICPSKLSHGDVKAYATKKTFERYDYLKKRSEMPNKFVMCLGPRCGCGQEHDEGLKLPLMVCNKCNFKTCVRHKLPWHEGMTCEEFDLSDEQLERLEEEEATAKLLAGQTMICPKCSQGVHKSDGCDHMRCQCGEEWCYVCGCNWENIIRLGEVAHAPTCSYHPNRVGLRRDQRDANDSRMMQLVHGGEVSEQLTAARNELRQRRRAMMRPLAAKAAEERLRKAQEEQKMKKSGSPTAESSKKKKVKLLPAWEEGGHSKKAF